MIRAASSEPYPYMSSRRGRRVAAARARAGARGRLPAARSRRTGRDPRTTGTSLRRPGARRAAHPEPVQGHAEQVCGGIGDRADPAPALPELQERVLHQLRRVVPVPGHEVQGLEEAACSSAKNVAKRALPGPVGNRMTSPSACIAFLDAARTMDSLTMAPRIARSLGASRRSGDVPLENGIAGRGIDLEGRPSSSGTRSASSTRSTDPRRSDPPGPVDAVPFEVFADHSTSRSRRTLRESVLLRVDRLREVDHGDPPPQTRMLYGDRSPWITSWKSIRSMARRSWSSRYSASARSSTDRRGVAARRRSRRRCRSS